MLEGITLELDQFLTTCASEIGVKKVSTNSFILSDGTFLTYLCLTDCETNVSQSPITVLYHGRLEYSIVSVFVYETEICIERCG